jgi:hypothetical protein
MADQAPRGEASLAMKFSNMINEEAGSAHDGAGGSATDEPLFGDARWIEERLKALRNPDETGMRQEAD